MAANHEASANPRCGSCINHLSYFPISLTPNGENICGRCTIPPNSVRNEVYENLAVFREFPCRYQELGCTRKVLPVDMKIHERLCRDREIVCTVVTCNWKGSLNAIVTHYLDDHIYDPNETKTFMIDIKDKPDDYFPLVIMIKNRIFTVKIDWTEINKTTLQVLLTFDGIEKQGQFYQCSAVMEIGKHESRENFNVSIPLSEKAFVLNMNSSESTQLKGSLKFQAAEDDPNEVVTNLLIMDCVRCTECKFDMSPIRYLNQIYCIFCFMKKFPFVSIPYDDALLSIISTIKYPCRFKKDGCPFSDTLTSGSVHTKTCYFSNSKCHFFSCTWEGKRGDLLKHILDDHEINSNFIEEIGSFGSVGAIAFDEHLLWVLTIVNEVGFYVTAQLITVQTENLKYQVDICHKNKNKITIEKPCCIFDEPIDFYSNNKMYNCSFSQEQLDFFLGTGVRSDDLRVKVEVLEMISCKCCKILYFVNIEFYSQICK